MSGGRGILMDIWEHVKIINIFVSYANTHQSTSPMRETLSKQADKMTRRADVRQLLSSATTVLV